jgi:hypothetical protein
MGVFFLGQGSARAGLIVRPALFVAGGMEIRNPSRVTPYSVTKNLFVHPTLVKTIDVFNISGDVKIRGRGNWYVGNWFGDGNTGGLGFSVPFHNQNGINGFWRKIQVWFVGGDYVNDPKWLNTEFVIGRKIYRFFRQIVVGFILNKAQAESFYSGDSVPIIFEGVSYDWMVGKFNGERIYHKHGSFGGDVGSYSITQRLIGFKCDDDKKYSSECESLFSFNSFKLAFYKIGYYGIEVLCFFAMIIFNWRLGGLDDLFISIPLSPFRKCRRSFGYNLMFFRRIR